jgi:rod shape-determining protein MreC
VALSRRTGRSRFTLILLVLTSITVITLDFRGAGGGVFEDVREGALDLFAPVKDAADSVFEPVGDAWNGVFRYGDLEEENARLKDQLAELQGDRDRVEEVERAFDELLAQNQLDFARDVPQVSARVISSPLSNFELSFELDKGRDAGIKEGMTVVSGRGLVGRVVRVSASRSVVELLTDRDFAVGIRLRSSGEIGIATGGGREQPLSLSGIDPGVEIRRRELATTSGLPQSAFPPGIPVGRVQEATSERGELEQEVQLAPIADVERLTFVKVLIWEPASG